MGKGSRKNEYKSIITKYLKGRCLSMDIYVIDELKRFTGDDFEIDTRLWAFKSRDEALKKMTMLKEELLSVFKKEDILIINDSNENYFEIFNDDYINGYQVNLTKFTI